MLDSLDQDTRSILLRVAREAITAHLGRREAGLLELREQPDCSGVFVTVHVEGALRGCIGFLALQGGLVETIAEAARRAATEDPRFLPVEASELDRMEVDVTLLGPLERLENPEDFEIGRHGLLIDALGRRGLLLPQVATDHGWDRRAFLSGLCRKAGIPDHSWEQPGARLSRFEGLVLAENDAGNSTADRSVS